MFEARSTWLLLLVLGIAHQLAPSAWSRSVISRGATAALQR
jgi:hypothetical protein